MGFEKKSEIGIFWGTENEKKKRKGVLNLEVLLQFVLEYLYSVFVPFFPF